MLLGGGRGRVYKKSMFCTLVKMMKKWMTPKYNISINLGKFSQPFNRKWLETTSKNLAVINQLHVLFC